MACLDKLANQVNAINPSRRKRVLFFAEAVTLAHITRPLVLAQSLDARDFDIHFASTPGKDFLFRGQPLSRWPIQNISEERFLEALAKGAPLYDYRTLSEYVQNDLDLLDRVKPDLVVGDFRLSLAISAPLLKLTYVNLTNAHWSPFTTSKRFPLPNIPLTRVFGVQLASLMFQMATPLVFAYHARAFNRLRVEHGLPRLGNLLDVYTYGDYTLYADVPDLVPTINLPANHSYIGPILWSPDIDLPPWWDSLNQERPIAYVTLGSSGRIDIVPTILKALEGLPISVMLATAGRLNLASLPETVWKSDFIPGDKAAARSAIVICNGGSATVYQALKQGTPVIGIASNMDQFLTMSAVTRAGAGILLRADSISFPSVQESVRKVLSDGRFKLAAQRIANQFSAYHAPSRFRAFVERLLT